MSIRYNCMESRVYMYVHVVSFLMNLSNFQSYSDFSTYIICISYTTLIPQQLTEVYIQPLTFVILDAHSKSNKTGNVARHFPTFGLYLFVTTFLNKTDRCAISPQQLSSLFYCSCTLSVVAHKGFTNSTDVTATDRLTGLY